MEIFDQISEQQRQELSELTATSNERLVQAGSQGAEQAFGLGCALGLLPLIAIVIGLYVWGVFPFLVALIAFVMGALVLLGGITLLSFNAKRRAIGETYRKEVGPDILAFLGRSKIQEEQFSLYVSDLLPEEAPLRSFHTVSRSSIDIPDQE